MLLLRGETSLKQGPVINQVQERLTLNWVPLTSNKVYYREILIHYLAFRVFTIEKLILSVKKNNLGNIGSKRLCRFRVNKAFHFL